MAEQITERVELDPEKIKSPEGLAELNRMLRELYEEVKSIDTRVTALEP